MSSPKEARKFHEAERHSLVLTHSDFAHEETFEYLEESEEFNNFLLEKTWDKYFITQKNLIVVCDTVIANKVFDECYRHFGKKMDTVQIFHLITDFYNIDARRYFNKLLQLYRKRLARDLEERMGKLKSTDIQKIGEDRVQIAFNLIFNK